MSPITPGQRVRVSSRINGRDIHWQNHVEGVAVSVEPLPTGSWFAGGKNDKLWLRRILLRKDDGELTLVNVDADTDVAVVG